MELDESAVQSLLMGSEENQRNDAALNQAYGGRLAQESAEPAKVYDLTVWFTMPPSQEPLRRMKIIGQPIELRGYLSVSLAEGGVASFRLDYVTSWEAKLVAEDE